ncbi:protein FAM83F [Pygocentrus nattereri]|uniref:Scaffolding anchor of CK1 domain-containing protein n=1 Tax=Pygocentrus nattereri TaxID=42514 RepID=A0A3B4EFX1_PYGNA|nr:protein FAM83F [Pygocentrus nattereri]
MAESQLACMEDGQITQTIPETKPEFYYSEQQRAALETLLRDGDGAFKTRLDQDKAKDFLSAREIKVIRNSLVQFKTSEEEENEQRAQGRSADSSSMRSTYWPQMSDTEVPPLDIGWPHGGFFRGVTRVAVHTHPPKENGPHLKEVVRRLIQEASKVIAIVMDLLTDLQILQDLFDAASKRRVPVYIILDIQGVPYFLDMCNRLQVKSHHLQNIRTRVVKGVGFELSYGRIPGSLCSKYMIVDGDKVMFGSYSFSWTSSRMDRNMITVMSGQIVDFFDNDFRELYAISDKLDLFKEFHVGKPSTGTLGRMTVPKRPSLSATSRFQVSLGDAGTLKVPEHKYYNPKYLLAFGNIPGPSGSLPDLSGKKQTEASPEELASEKIPTQAGSDKLDTLKRLPAESTEKGTIKKFFNKYRSSQKSKGNKNDDSAAAAAAEEGTPSPSTSSKPAMPNGIEDLTNIPEEPPPPVKEKSKKKINSSQLTINSQETKGRKQSKNKCVQS